MKRAFVVLFFATVFAGPCAAQSMFRNFHQEGPASQEINTLEMTISHPSLPLGTQIRVTNPRNGKQINARVTGRIPATEGRIADVSRGVAEALELSSRARNPVVLEIVNERTPRPAPPEPEAPPPEPEEPPPEPEEPPPEPEAPPPEPEAPPPEPATEEPPLLPPHEDPVKEPAPEAPAPGASPETEFVPGEDPPAPSVSTADSKTQTTAPVAAQSPNITIYNVLQSPNSFATDSAPVNTGGNGTGSGPAADGTQQQVPIIAAAPSALVDVSERSRSNTDSSGSNNSNNSSTSAQPPASTAVESGKPAVATATAQIVAPIQGPQAPVQQPPVGQRPPAQAPQSPASPAPQTPAPQPGSRLPPQQGQPVQPQQSVQPQQPVRPPEPSPLPPMVDRGTAVIRPYMPSADNGKIYRVQVGSYKNTWHAREAFDRLTTVGFSPSYEGYGDYIRVVISGVPAADIPSVARLLGRVGFTEALIREEN
ncbi:MAG: SPOR domain-containing protein [Treponema sp.]|nr:SPOR domain-containing protein [Treponema sp.]